MIDSHDRSGWFGASDTAMIMGNWETKTFKKWWMQKLGLNTAHFSTVEMNAGTYYEHAILDAIGAPRKDHQILIPALHLRINLDGDKPAVIKNIYFDNAPLITHTEPGEIYEVKTHKAEKKFKVSKHYWMQVQVQMFGKSVVEMIIPKAEIISYPLTEQEYKNFFLEIDPERITRHSIEYDPEFIKAYIERLKILCRALEEGIMPKL